MIPGLSRRNWPSTRRHSSETKPSRRDRYIAPGEAAQFLQPDAQLDIEVVPVLSLGGHDAASLCRNHATRAALEQLHADRTFGSNDGPLHGRRGEAQLSRRSTNQSAVGHRRDVADGSFV